MGGTSISHLRKRLIAVGRRDLLQAAEDGKISIYAAATAAGLRVRRPIAGTGNSSRAKRRQRALERIVSEGPSVSAQQQELWLGAGRAGSLWCTPAELRRAWLLHRDQVMAWWGNHGRRPQGWWRFEADGLAWPGREQERSVLWRANRLTDAERVELERFWRVEFNRCTARNFAIVKPWPDPPLEGDAARAAHLAWADCPRELIEAWCGSVPSKTGEQKTEGKAPPG
jgi:hypothetical protein